jgi:hypothetical protein
LPVPRQWPDVLRAPAFVVNLDSRPDRLAATTEALRDAGFSDLRRFPAVDARDQQRLERAWKACGSPPFAAWDSGFEAVPGKQGCFLSHVALWQEILDLNLPFACIFEDDVVFHRHWAQLAPTAFTFTPQDYYLLYMGNMIITPGPGLVRQTPVYCTHAYVITREGAARLRPLLLDDPEGVGSIDIMLYRQQQLAVEQPARRPFTWYAWNGTRFADGKASAYQEWANRNTGLVFQDFEVGTDIGVARPD